MMTIIIQARIPDIIVVDANNKKACIVDIPVPADKRITDKEHEKGRNTRIWKGRQKTMEIDICPIRSSPAGCIWMCPQSDG